MSKGTVSGDWKRATGDMDEQSIIRSSSDSFKIIHCFLVFNFWFYFLKRSCRLIAHFYVNKPTLWKNCQRFLATLCQVCYSSYRVLATFWWFRNRYWQRLQWSHICQEVFAIWYWLPYWAVARDNCKSIVPLAKNRTIFSAKPLKYLNVGINYKEATARLKTNRGSFPN